MNKTLVALLAFFAVFLITFTSFAISTHMDKFCAKPEGRGNWIVQPFCTK